MGKRLSSSYELNLHVVGNFLCLNHSSFFYLSKCFKGRWHNKLENFSDKCLSNKQTFLDFLGISSSE